MQVTVWTRREHLEALRASLIADRGYYDSPCGYRKVLLAHVAPAVPSWAVDAHGCGELTPFSTPKVRLGLTEGPNGMVLWVRSSGSWVLVDPDGGRLWASGRRHALRGYFSEALREDPATSWEYNTTERPDLAPWEVTT